jgi:hypothetical protein
VRCCRPPSSQIQQVRRRPGPPCAVRAWTTVAPAPISESKLPSVITKATSAARTDGGWQGRGWRGWNYTRWQQSGAFHLAFEGDGAPAPTTRCAHVNAERNIEANPFTPKSLSVRLYALKTSPHHHAKQRRARDCSVCVSYEPQLIRLHRRPPARKLSHRKVPM